MRGGRGEFGSRSAAARLAFSPIVIWQPICDHPIFIRRRADLRMRGAWEPEIVQVESSFQNFPVRIAVTAVRAELARFAHQPVARACLICPAAGRVVLSIPSRVVGTAGM